MSRSVEYASFLIRLWREVGAEQPSTAPDWRSEVEHIQTGDCWQFETLEELLNFLRRESEDDGRQECSKGAGSG
jgi:hypothetical protein